MTRLPGIRVARIGVWTALATAWTAAGIAAVATPPPQNVQADRPSGAETVVAPTAATIPAMPEGGLVVVRHTPADSTAQPEPVVVRRVVVEQPPPAPVVQTQGS